jgi:predicted permease
MNNLRDAFRQLVRRPGLSIAVILMLALGLGASTAIFSLFHEVLIRPLPVPEPDRLVNFAYVEADGQTGDATSYPMFRDLEAQQSVFTGIAARVPLDASVSFGDEARRISGELVSGSYFQVLGLQPALGRLIGPQDEPRIDESAVVVLSRDLWQRRFGADANVIGDQLVVNGQSLTIIGVAPERFAGSQLGVRTELFVPLTMRTRLEPGFTRSSMVFENRSFSSQFLTAHLRPGVDVEQASASLNVIYSGIRREIEAPTRSLSGDEQQAFLQGRVELLPGARGWGVIEGADRSLTLLLGVTLLVVAIVCLNVANLLFARGASRAGEMAVRESLGASRGRLLTQLLIEAAVPAVIGGALSLAVAAAALAAIEPILPPRLADGLAMEVSPAAALFAAVTTIATALLASLAPSLRASRTSPALAMKGYAVQTLGGRGTPRMRGGLVTVQIAFSMVLLVLAVLFAQSLANVARIDLGIDVDSLVSFNVSPRANGNSPERTYAVYGQIEQALAAQPGVAGVSSAAIPLLAGRGFGISGLFVEGFDNGGEPVEASVNIVGSEFFETLSIGLLKGREFTTAEMTGPPRVAIVNERFARAYGLRSGAVGKHITFGEDDPVEIVGVVADAAYGDVKGDVPPQYFVPRTLDPSGPLSLFSFLGSSATFYVRAAIDPDALLAAIPRVVASVEPTLPLSNVVTLRRQAQDSIFVDRLVTMLSVSFAALATVLAAIGLYGVLSYGIAQRTRELGLRLALGAEPANVRAMVLRHVALLAAIGIVAGGVAAIGFGRVAESLLYGLTAADPRAFAAAAVLLSLVVLGAAYLPARRASRIAPMEALRYE